MAQMSSFVLLLECLPVDVSHRGEFMLIGTLFAIEIDWGKSVPLNLNSPYITEGAAHNRREFVSATSSKM